LFTLKEAEFEGQSRTVVNTHSTSYKHYSNEFTFPSWSSDCAFTLPTSFEKFENIHCEHWDGIPIRRNTIETEFRVKPEREMIKYICKHVRGTGDHGTKALPDQLSKKYKTIDLMSYDVCQFLKDTLFANLFQCEFMLMFDVVSDHITILTSDEEEYRLVIYIDPARCMRACYAHLNKSIASKREIVCLEKWNACANAIVQRVKLEQDG